jgi:hypothetical protein
MIFRKGCKKSFFGKIHFKKSEKIKSTPLAKNSIVGSKMPAKLSLSIKGNKQTASLICLKIKNLKELESIKGNAEETLQKIVNHAEAEKAAIYENGNNLFIILAPALTKTFANERTAIELAQKIKSDLENHNKLYKQKIHFGIAINTGSIITKLEEGTLKFMSMGTLITTAKKIASISKGEILLSEKLREKVMTEVKTEKHVKEKTPVYTIKEIKSKTANKRFISEFIHRLEHKKDKK